ncbi:CotH kinase family protein [Myxococcaceae bacterium GXIMD 01537]
MPAVSRTGVLATLMLFLSACGDGRPEGWSEATHGKKVDPAYATVFPSDKVLRFDITIAAADWQAMQDDMTDMLGAFGAGGGAPGGGAPGGGGGMTPPAELTAACQDKVEGAECTATLNGSTFTSTCEKTPDGALLCRPQGGPGGGVPPGGGGVPPGGGGGAPGGGGTADLVPRTPIYVPSTVQFEGKTWWHVGVRFKGNSTLSGAWRSGVGKLPLRFNFDKFEDEHPEIEGQHFYGFSKLSLSNNQGDSSLLRDKIASDTFLAAGVPAPHTAFAAVYVDHGNGPEYFGLYTLAEDPQDSLLQTNFGNSSGALYEADGTGAKWVTFDEESFEAENEAAEAGWDSVKNAISALNSDRADAAAWRARLEARLDVDGFLRWLAINTVLVNWDSYGAMSHNYYLYADPNDGDRVRWITWDHNLSMMSGRGATQSLSLSEVTADWPLIRFLMDDPVYRAKYQQYARESVNGPLAAATLQERIRAAHDLIAPWVVGENAERQGFTFTTAQQFEESVTGTTGLLKHVEQREAAVRAELP